MKLLLKNCLIKDLKSPDHNQQKDLLLEDGVIKEIGSNLNVENADVKDLNGAWASPGFFDLHAHYCDPGNEFKEDLHSGVNTAKSGGFTRVAVLPNTEPTVDNKSQVQYIKNGSSALVQLHALGALSKGVNGNDLSELFDLNEAGSVAFTDGVYASVNDGLFMNALKYAQQFDGLVMVRPSLPFFLGSAQMHEGIESTKLGLRGEPSRSEKIQIFKYLDLLEYAGGKVHFILISSKEGVEAVRAAKQKGLQVTCDVNIHHLLFTDSALKDFDVNQKVWPPYRTEEDRQALIEGVKDGTIDALVSGHNPQDIESKAVAFNEADFRAIGQQTVFSVMNMLRNDIDTDILLDKLSHGARSILDIQSNKIEVGANAELSFFNPTTSWKLDESTNTSKSFNSPFWQQHLSGKCVGIVNGKHSEFNS